MDITKEVLELIDRYWEFGSDGATKSNIGDKLHLMMKVRILLDSVGKGSIPLEIQDAQKFIRECEGDIGFMGSPVYYEMRRKVADYFGPIKQKLEEEKEIDEYIRLREKYEKQ